jgi:replication factor A1
MRIEKRRTLSKNTLTHPIPKGPIEIQKELGSVVRITAGHAVVEGYFNESTSGKYLVVFDYGFPYDFPNGGLRHKYGYLCLIEDAKEVLWSTELEHPKIALVSDAGRVVAVIENQRRRRTPEGKTAYSPIDEIYVFDNAGNQKKIEFFSTDVQPHLNSCAVSPSGRYAAFGDSFTIYLVDIENQTLLGQVVRNHVQEWDEIEPSKRLICDISFPNDDEIVVHTGPTPKIAHLYSISTEQMAGKIIMHNCSFSIGEVRFLLSHRCTVHPYCYLVANRTLCLRAQASGLNCADCQYYVSSESEGSKLGAFFLRFMTEREAKHYEFLGSRRWEKIVKPQMLKYDDYTCRICERRSLSGMHVHHIIAFSADADLSPRNLVVLCQRCHAILEGLLPVGMLCLGWPNIDAKKLKEFYLQVRRVSEKNQERFKAPLESRMGHICLVCPEKDECPVGVDEQKQIELNMKAYDRLLLAAHRHHVAELRDGMNHITIEGRITDMGEAKEVDTRYGKTSLVVARVGDDTGQIILTLFGDQADGVHIGDTVRVENGYVSTYQDRLTLNIPKGRGKLVVNPEYSVPFPSEKVRKRGSPVEGTCPICGTKFNYQYTGGRARKYCERCA